MAVKPTIKSVKINFTYHELRLIEISMITRIGTIDALLKDLTEGERLHKLYTLEKKELQVTLNKIVIYFQQMESNLF